MTPATDQRTAPDTASGAVPFEAGPATTHAPGSGSAG
jgi:hypothetical protein